MLDCVREVLSVWGYVVNSYDALVGGMFLIGCICFGNIVFWLGLCGSISIRLEYSIFRGRVYGKCRCLKGGFILCVVSNFFWRMIIFCVEEVYVKRICIKGLFESSIIFYLEIFYLVFLLGIMNLKYVVLKYINFSFFFYDWKRRY